MPSASSMRISALPSGVPGTVPTPRATELANIRQGEDTPHFGPRGVGDRRFILPMRHHRLASRTCLALALVVPLASTAGGIAQATGTAAATPGSCFILSSAAGNAHNDATAGDGADVGSLDLTGVTTAARPGGGFTVTMRVSNLTLDVPGNARGLEWDFYWTTGGVG